MFTSGQPRVRELFSPSQIFLSKYFFIYRNLVCSPPPSYQEVYAAERDQPPTYEDVVKIDADKQNVQTQDDEDDQIELDEPEEGTGQPDDQQMNDFLQHENQDNPEINTNDEVSENPAVEIES